ncbi:MAG TPA: response regulator [Candidatus Dormibacteraeota bacterium]|nr:response regulator [Candidatus Dormibacteraeota bacterium]
MARKILLADDSVTAQNMGRKILADAGYEVITVNNGSAALKKISEQKPDLIVLDVYMPGYSGLEVCQRIKEVAETSRIPILLTVGKLEPFKPEEAKRVRADGFIVKPFEASELLSALSKLEDKVVPRPETSKTGRFARATAAIEEARYDKTMSVEEEDSGWKNRISFPPKKKEKPAEVEADDPAVYNPVNKDLRTVMEPKAAEAQATAHPETDSGKPERRKSERREEEKHVNLGALAPEGLPKDVTPEEIAALAAAAAQVKGKIGAEEPAAPVAEMAVTAPAEVEAPKAQSIEAARAESKEEIRAAVAAALPEVPAPAPVGTFAEQHTAEKIAEKKTEPHIVSTQADAMTAIMGLETQMFAVHFPTPGDGSGPNPAANPAQEPVTMAVTAPAYSGPTVSRWTAVAVALTPEDSPASLEEEMQKAFAAAAAASATQATPAAAVAEPVPVSSVAAEPSPVPIATFEPQSPVATPAEESAAPALAEVAPEAAATLNAVSSAATEAIEAAVKELESVAASYVAERNPAPAEAVAPQPAEPVAESLVASGTGPSHVEELKAEPSPAFEAAAPMEAKADTVEAAQPQASQESRWQVDRGREDREEEKATSIEAVSETAVPAPVHEAVPVHDVVEKKQDSEEDVSAEPAAKVVGPSKSGGTDDMAKRESETAAAWASWRKIRETGGSKSGATESGSKESEEEFSPKDAAMAVAAGSENRPEEASASLDSDPEIASIVDSVLADMRPKIVEEIARKMGRKK